MGVTPIFPYCTHLSCSLLLFPWVLKKQRKEGEFITRIINPKNIYSVAPPWYVLINCYLTGKRKSIYVIEIYNDLLKFKDIAIPLFSPWHGKCVFWDCRFEANSHTSVKMQVERLIELVSLWPVGCCGLVTLLIQWSSASCGNSLFLLIYSLKWSFLLINVVVKYEFSMNSCLCFV